MNPREIYERDPAGAGREASCKLRPHEWDLYLRLDGERSMQEISTACKTDLQWIACDLRRLQELELVRAVEVGLEEYRERFARGRAAASVAVAAAAAGPAAAPATNVGKRVSFSLRRGEAARPTAAAPTPARLEPPASVRAEEHRLKPLLDFITGHSGGGTVGQLAAYRVFLKVPNELLRQAGIRSLNLVSEDFTIRDAGLWRALLHAVEEVLGKRYVAAPVAEPAAETEMAA